MNHVKARLAYNTTDLEYDQYVELKNIKGYHLYLNKA